jgi:Protein of unknown function (DUF3435)
MRALADDAFAAQDPPITTPAQFYQLQVLPGMGSLPLTFKTSMEETPFFRDDEGNVLKYGAIRNSLIRLGNATGFDQILKPYCLRRGVANAIHGKRNT